MICLHCERSFQRDPNAVKKARRHYCSPACHHAGRRAKYDDRLARYEAERRRQARKRATTINLGSHTAAEWEDLKRRARHRCVKCRKKKALTRDHIIPLSRGGSDRITNIQPLCLSCNSRKRDVLETLL